METHPPTLRLRKNEEASNLTNTNDASEPIQAKNRKSRRPSNDILFCSLVILVSFSIIIYRSSSNSSSMFSRIKVCKVFCSNIYDKNDNVTGILSKS